jgi:hypothetical protein
MKKPAFFISSTIFDLKDLRSSIKWWLEENGYTVNASEFNDFDKPLNTNSYEACLRAIDSSDYFILIIGDRIGGMYDEDITITQKEYKYAYECMLAGKLKIINLIRQETNANFSILKNKIKELKQNSSSFPEPFLNDEEKIRFKFIDEVRRVEEMKKGEKPKNNWLHTFNTFKDVTEVFRIELGDKINLSYKQNRLIIFHDISKNLQKICSKHEDGIYSKAVMGQALWEDFKLDIDTNSLTLSHKRHVNYASFYIAFMQMQAMKINRLESFYQSGFFLDYDNTLNDYISGDLNKMILALLNTYERLNNLHKSLYEDSSKKILALRKRNDGSAVKVTSVEIFFALKFNDAVINCMDLSKNIYKALNGLKYSIHIPITNERMIEEMIPKDEDFVTEIDILKYLNSD